MGPTDGMTDLDSAIDSCMQLNPKRALIVIVTDGAVAAGSFLFNPEALRAEQGRMRHCEPLCRKQHTRHGSKREAIIIHVTPDRAGRTTMNLLKTFVASKNS